MKTLNDYIKESILDDEDVLMNKAEEDSKNPFIVIGNLIVASSHLAKDNSTQQAIDKIINMYNPDLIITVDCGISSHDEVEYCKEKGLDIIITDHHDIPDVVPETLVINAKLPNQMYPFHDLCGAGVALKLVQALAGLEEALKYTPPSQSSSYRTIAPNLLIFTPFSFSTQSSYILLV